MFLSGSIQLHSITKASEDLHHHNESKKTKLVASPLKEHAQVCLRIELLLLCIDRSFSQMLWSNLGFADSTVK